MSDATSVLFGLEHEFSVLEVQRIDTATVKVIIEQAAREARVRSAACLGHGEGSVVDAVEGSAGVGTDGPAVVAEAPPDL